MAASNARKRRWWLVNTSRGNSAIQAESRPNIGAALVLYEAVSSVTGGVVLFDHLRARGHGSTVRR